MRLLSRFGLAVFGLPLAATRVSRVRRGPITDGSARSAKRFQSCGLNDTAFLFHITPPINSFNMPVQGIKAVTTARVR